MTSAPPLAAFAHWFFQKKIVEKLFIIALATFIFCYLPLLAAYRGAESVMILTFLWLAFVSGRETGLRSAIVRDPLFLACLALLGFLILARLWYSFSLPPGIDPETRETRYVLKPVLVFLVAFGLGIVTRPYRWALLLLGMLGFAAYLLTTIGSGQWINAWVGRREDFGIHNAQHTAMFFGTALIGTVCFMFRAIKASPPGWRYAVIFFVFLTLAVAAFGLIATQTRAAWLGVTMATMIGLTTAAWLIWKKRDKPFSKGHKKAAFGLALCLLFGFVLAGLNAPDRVKAPFSNSQSDNGQLFSIEQYTGLPEHSSNPRTSHGVRLISWRVALEWFKERPLMGWGPGSTKDLIKQSEFFSEHFKKNFGHLHNSFIESLVANGLIGSAILLAMIVWIGYAALTAYRNGKMPVDVLVFALSFFGFWAAINLFESYTLYSTGHYTNAVVVGFIYSFYLQLRDKDQSP
ncbi:O-antigen ligase family protein [Marinobacter sp.]|uniref:O-antigen ligase family protein n=1 Tax=Marinobacter sp. TaxID=50741 RepID=UPI003A92561A